MTNSQFNPALPLPIKWSIGSDKFDPEKEVLSLTIPVDSVTHLIDHLKNSMALLLKQLALLTKELRNKVSSLHF